MYPEFRLSVKICMKMIFNYFSGNKTLTLFKKYELFFIHVIRVNESWAFKKLRLCTFSLQVVLKYTVATISNNWTLFSKALYFSQINIFDL